MRDRLLGRASPDVDAVVEDDPQQVAAELAARSRLPWFPLSLEFGAYRVVGGAGHLDLLALQGGSLEADLGLRDFTVNAMALPVAVDQAGVRDPALLVDPFGGRRDLADRRLVAVSPGIFEKDPLRLLRAWRLGHTLGLEPDPDLVRLVAAHAWRLPQAAPERILAEVALAFREGGAAIAVCLLSRLGLLDVLFPEVAALRAVVYPHTLATLRALDDVLRDPAEVAAEAWPEVAGRLARPVDGVLSRPAALRLAGLLLSSGRPAARARTPGGDPVYWGHAALGAHIAGEACCRLRCSKAASGLVVKGVGEQGLLAELADREREPARRDLVLALWRASPWEPETILLAAAAAEAEVAVDAGLETAEGRRSGGAAPPFLVRRRRVARRLLSLWRERGRAGILTPPVDGNDLMAELSLVPGPLLGRVLREVALAWESEELSDRASALDYARSIVEGFPQPYSQGEPGGII